MDENYDFTCLSFYSPRMLLSVLGLVRVCTYAINKIYLETLKTQHYTSTVYFNGLTWCEPRHDKTNKMSVRPAKIQISLGIRLIWSVFAVHSMDS